MYWYLDVGKSRCYSTELESFCGIGGLIQKIKLGEKAVLRAPKLSLEIGVETSMRCT